MGETETENDSENWKKFLKRHWNMAAFWIIALILAVAGAVLVLQWFVEDSQATGMVPASLAQWTPAHMLTFALHLAMWEILLIGIPVIVLAVAGWLWWKRIPEEERKEYELFSKRSRAENGGGGISFLLFVAFCLKVYIDGRWNVPIASWTLDYVVESMISLLAWSAIVFGIPAIIIGLIYLSHEIRKS